jgi:hypothetical protein
MPIAYVSDEYYAAIADCLVEFRREGTKPLVVRSAPSGAVYADLEPGQYEVILSRDGFSPKRTSAALGVGKPVHFRLLSDNLVGYAWPKWCRSGEAFQARVHSTEQYQLTLWRYGLEKEFVRMLGWFDEHGPRAATQRLPDGFFVETGVSWRSAASHVDPGRDTAPERSGLYYLHAKTLSGEFFSFPLVVAPAKPAAPIAVLASTNTWNAYNTFGGRSNYCMAERMIDEPIVNVHADLPRFRLPRYGEWKLSPDFAPLSFDRPEPANHVPEHTQCSDPIEGRRACGEAPAEWRTLAWLERQGYPYDLYSEWQLHDGTLDLDAYRILLLNVHPEYWSEEMYRKVKNWVFERGGKLMYLGGNGINCNVELLDGYRMRCLNHWPEDKESRFHNTVESEANLLGVVYSDPGAMTAAPYAAIEPDHWVFAGTGLKRGELFGTRTLHERCAGGASGHETDKITPSSPKNIVLLAKGTNADEGGAHMTLFDTPSGGSVFSAGSITYATALLVDTPVSTITANVLDRFLG